MRGIALYVLMMLWTVCFGALILPLLLLPKRYVRYAARTWVHVVLWLANIIVGITYTVAGDTTLLRQQGIVIACRHESMFETLAIFLLCPKPIFILKRTLLFVPFFGWFCAKLGMIPLDRSGKVHALHHLVSRVKKIPRQDHQLVIFPEGTRLLPHEHPPLKRGIIVLYEALEQMVIPIFVNSGTYWPKKPWHMRQGLIILKIHDPIHPTLPRDTFMHDLMRGMWTS
jgi:1-acyl-sn-glycerol-3-phosphate acyltransferase